MNLHTRRSFLRSSALGGALTCTVPSFLAATFDRLHADADGSPVAARTGTDSPILVVLQLAGGNDGLNTVVPFADDAYHRARPRLGLKSDAVLPLTDTTGLHPALRGLRELFDAGHLGIVQSVGYPNPNRSHFRSTDIWMTATDSDRVSSLGWLGRYFDHTCTGSDPTVGLAITRQAPLAFAANKPTGVALENPEAFRFADLDAPEADEQGASGTFYRQMTGAAREVSMEDATRSGSSVEAAGGSAGTNSGSPLDYLERTALDAQISSDRIRSVAARGRNEASYPASRLANDMKLVARLIAGGLGTRVYFVSQGGYDTHTNQVPTHARLLGELGDAVAAFQKDLQALGRAEQVVLLTFSEFGRRVAENRSGGTDHGAAAPLFVVGSRVRPGLHGPAPNLAPGSLVNGDVTFATDFRSVYATLLEQWLQTSPAPVLGRAFPSLPLLQS
jgi:uncharacterized protein (DUF1501 family)